jgi:hypothetical protein
VTDTATGSGGQGQPTPTGTVDFYLCAPNEVTAGGCETGGTLISDDVALVNGSATSAAANPTAVGKYCWRAEYSGDDFYLSSNHTNSTTECFTIQDTTSITSAQTWLPNDSATVSAGGGTPLNGSLTITLYETSDCTGDAVAGQSYSKTLTNATTAADRTLETNNSTYTVTATKTVSWKVVFTSTDANVAGQTHCESTSLTITN